MTRPTSTHRDCDRPMPITSIAQVHAVLKAHPTIDGKLCPAAILALDAMGRVTSASELPARTPNHDPRHRDRQWIAPDAGVIARIRDGLRHWTPQASR